MSTDTLVWIYCDELRADVLSCADGPHGLTPHLDRLAASGARFTGCWCSSPVCVPSRMAAVTGLPPTRTGIYHNEAAWPGFVPPVQPVSWIERLADTGWETRDFGKQHLPHGYAPFQHSDGTGAGMAALLSGLPREQLALRRPPGVATWIGGRWPDAVAYPPEQTTANVINALATRQPGRPTVLRASFLQPHTPVVPPDRYRERVDAMELDLNRFDREGWPSAFERAAATNVQGGEMPADEIAACRRDYLALVAWVDDQVGAILDAVAEHAPDAAIVFTADHGASLGEAGMWAKQVFAPASHRVPLLIRGAGFTPGSVRDDVCDSTDLAPTVARLAGIAADLAWTGRDLVTTASNDHAVFSIIGQGREDSRQFPNLGFGDVDGAPWPRRACLRTQRWRYERTVRVAGQPIAATDPAADAVLIDSQADPDEVHNLIADPGYAEQIAGCERQLWAWLTDAVEPDWSACGESAR